MDTTGLSSQYNANGGVLIFPTITEQAGAAYDAKTGVFTCKEPGIYYFAVRLSDHSAGASSATIKRNSEELCKGHTDGSNYRNYGCEVTIKLAKDDTISVYLTGGAIYTGNLSSFTGYKIN